MTKLILSKLDGVLCSIYPIHRFAAIFSSVKEEKNKHARRHDKTNRSRLAKHRNNEVQYSLDLPDLYTRSLDYFRSN